MFRTLIFVSMELSYGIVGWETLLTLTLPMFGFEESHLCIKVICVGFSSVW